MGAQGWDLGLVCEVGVQGWGVLYGMGVQCWVCTTKPTRGHKVSIGVLGTWDVCVAWVLRGVCGREVGCIVVDTSGLGA